jgi:tRNA 2-thiocytidine biosynthesis protein TtcA
MLGEWDKRFPGRRDTIFGALKNVAPSHLADPKVFDFAHLETLRNSAVGQADNDDGLDILSM